MEKLFVYGTLGPNRPNEHILKDIGGTWQDAKINGTLHDEGWGANMGYPGIVLDNSPEEIDGFVFSSNNLCNHWKMLDEFEGIGYERVLSEIKLLDRTSTKAYIYILKK